MKGKPAIALHTKRHTFQTGHTLGCIAQRYEKPMELLIIHHGCSVPSPFGIVYPVIPVVILDFGSVLHGVIGRPLS